MSHPLINHNDDLRALREAGYEVTIRSNHLVLQNVPYVTASKEVKLGTLISVLELRGEDTIPPTQHVTYFTGEHPCDEHGRKLQSLEHSSPNKNLADGVRADHQFSCKLLDERNQKRNYVNYFEKMQTYVERITAPAKKIDPNVRARTFIVADSDDPDPIFNYRDTASTRAGIGAISEKLKVPKVAIIGLGGTGSYILDFLAKTPIGEIHLFDSDDYLQHNAFRCPGAPSLNELRACPKKVDYLAAQYGNMRKHIFPHAYDIDESNIAELDGMECVFMSIDDSGAKQPIIEYLNAQGIKFIDVGMGLYDIDEKITGQLRVTTATPEKNDHVRRKVSLVTDENADVYTQNIQVAELNALNAALAVVKWKKMLAFYADLDHEHQGVYALDGNVIINSENKK